MNKKKNSKKDLNASISRRSFIGTSALASAGFMIVPRHVLGGPGFTAPSDTVNIAGIGIGGKGHSNLMAASGLKKSGKTLENVVALCDVDWKRGEGTFKEYPDAKKYKDFRKMLDEMGDDIDAVMVSTPDHTHAIAAMPCIQLGKHVYVEKPLTHNVYEARMLTEKAREKGVITQMGNQGSSGDDMRRIEEWISSGVIGEVSEVHAWTNRPVWPQGLKRPDEVHKVPNTLDWDLWLGPAPKRPYNDTYLPFSWRGWWDFGTGALGDMACHIMDPAVRALKLGYPSSVEAFASTYTENWVAYTFDESPPNSSMIRFEFPEREGLPPVSLTWYDGGLMPWRPAELKDGEKMGDNGGGVLFVGSKGKMVCDTYGRKPRLLPTSLMKDFKEPEPSLPRVEMNHQRSWIEAIKGGPKPSSNFDYAGKLSEIVLMGNLAIRSFFIREGLGRNAAFTGRKKLMWDGPNMKITNYEPANQFVKREYRKGWSLGV
ncbi:MAG: Gfo/Idh/MocA family oxidoreductase [Bacteroidota bacterium]